MCRRSAPRPTGHRPAPVARRDFRGRRPTGSAAPTRRDRRRPTIRPSRRRCRRRGRRPPRDDHGLRVLAAGQEAPQRGRQGLEDERPVVQVPERFDRVGVEERRDLGDPPSERDPFPRPRAAPNLHRRIRHPDEHPENRIEKGRRGARPRRDRSAPPRGHAATTAPTAPPDQWGRPGLRRPGSTRRHRSSIGCRPSTSRSARTATRTTPRSRAAHRSAHGPPTAPDARPDAPARHRQRRLRAPPATGLEASQGHSARLRDAAQSHDAAAVTTQPDAPQSRSFSEHLPIPARFDEVRPLRVHPGRF